MRDNSLLLFGCDFFPSRKTSEVNFWNDMVQDFSKSLREIVILSVNNRQLEREMLADNVVIYNVRPRYLGNSKIWTDPEYTGSRFHKLPLSVIYKSYSFLSYIALCQTLIERHNIDFFHYFRVFGLANKLLINRFPEVVFSITVPTHIDRGFPFHRAYHIIKNSALSPMDKIIPTSQATRDRLEKLGVDRNKLEVIPWSLKPTVESLDAQENARLTEELGLTGSERIILWSGPLQHTGDSEFQFALKVAKKVTQESEDFRFIFAFKPDKMKQEYSAIASGYDKIKLLETDRQSFLGLMMATDILLSPVSNPNRTVAPPLTWIEFMRNGIPVITTEVDGVDEIIQNQKNGFIVNSENETANLILSLSEDQLEKASDNSRITTSQYFNTDIISKQYLSMWDNALREKRLL